MDKINGRSIVMESYDKIKKTLAIAFMNDLDANRPEGKMCLSNGECADIEKAFNEQDWPRLAGYLDKYTESEDERIRTSLYTFFRGMLEGNEDCYKVGGFVKFEDIDVKSILAWLEKQKEQKPIQSNVEKEYIRTIKSLISDFLRGKDEIDRGYYQKIYDWLDGRHIEQKPTEWSKEDEFRLKETLEVLDESIRHLPIGYGYTTDVMNVTKWLKSLRPSWKPSRQQMDALHEALIRSCSHSYGVELLSLESDLLNLK